jgi:hypothetical protein
VKRPESQSNDSGEWTRNKPHLITKKSFKKVLTIITVRFMIVNVRQGKLKQTNLKDGNQK